jgi:hypothetical protein
MVFYSSDDVGDCIFTVRGDGKGISSSRGFGRREGILHQLARPFCAPPDGKSVTPNRRISPMPRWELELQRKPARHMFSPWWCRQLAVIDPPKTDPGSVEALQAEVDRLSGLVVAVNDALFGLSGIIARAVVETGLIGRAELADTIEQRAGLPETDDHNPLLLAFARSIRMNFPGGSFDVIDGGRTS